MIVRAALVAAAVGLVAFALWHPPSKPAFQTQPVIATASAPPDAGTAQRRRHGFRHDSAGGELVVYVVGAIKRPGLYRLHYGDRYARAVSLAGGFRPSADPAGINLAQRVADGDEVDVPAVGAASQPRVHDRRSRHHRATPPPDGSVDINVATSAEIAAIPGIGRSIASRIVELREREGSFASLDELLDVAGMTQSRLERARPYLRELAPRAR
jgi:competence protein ComEA